ncbi:MAG: MFS transporter, partial [Microcystaceae cyanobacterium]
FLLELPGGIISDRYNRITIMLATQSLMAIVAFLVAGLTAIGYTPLWLFVLANVFNGALSAFDSPARTVLISKIVPPEDLVDAQELYGTAANATAIVGPALSGVFLVYGHAELAFWFNALSFVPMLIILPLIRSSPQAISSREPPLQSLVEGVKYATQEPDLRTLILLATVVMVMGMPYQTLLSIFTHNVLHQGASAYAALTSISGCGAFLGSIAAALLPGVKYPGRILFGSSLSFGIALLLFSQSTSLGIGLLLVLVASTSGNLVVTMNSGLSQLITPPPLRGRIASINFLYKGALSISASAAGFLCHFLGLANTQLLFAGVMLLLLLPIRRYLVGFNPVLKNQRS